MVKPDGNLCKNGLKHGISECNGNGKDLLTECKNLSRILNIPDVTKGNQDKNINKQVIWKDHDKEVEAFNTFLKSQS